MYQSFLLSALVTIAFLQQVVNGQLKGVINHVGPEIDGILLATVENTSAENYSIEARNNLFDNANPFQPLTVTTLSGTPVLLVGTQVQYGELTDSAFVSMPPGAIWQRVFNMTEYIPPDSTATKAYSACFAVSFPTGAFAVNTTDFLADEDLATGFFGKASVELTITATPLHLNITVEAGLSAAAAAITQSVGTQAPATLVQVSATPGLGGAAPSIGASIDTYTAGAADIFA